MDIFQQEEARKFITYLLKGWADSRYIQELLGHSSSKTTKIDIHVSAKSLSRIKSFGQFKFLERRREIRRFAIPEVKISALRIYIPPIDSIYSMRKQQLGSNFKGHPNNG